MSIRQKEIMTNERRKKISDRFKGKQLSEQHTQQLSTIHKNRWKNMPVEEKENLLQQRRENPNYDKLKTLNPISYNAFMKHINEKKRRVGKYDSNDVLLEEFESITHASKSTNICYSNISAVCRKVPRYNTAGGFIWKYI